jgi:hypothetical protein
MTNTTGNAAAAMDWATFMRQPAAYIDLARLAACFNNKIGTAPCERLRGASRLQERVSAAITEHYALAGPVAPETVSEADRTIALLSAEELADLVRRAGAIFWANAIANVVLAADVRWLHEQMGEGLCAFALANRNLAGPARTLEPLAGVDARIREDGERCLAAWCQSLPTAVGSRVRLRRAPSAALDDAPQNPFDEIGPPIVRCAA